MSDKNKKNRDEDNAAQFGTVNNFGTQVNHFSGTQITQTTVTGTNIVSSENNTVVPGDLDNSRNNNTVIEVNEGIYGSLVTIGGTSSFYGNATINGNTVSVKQTLNAMNLDPSIKLISLSIVDGVKAELYLIDGKRVTLVDGKIHDDNRDTFYEMADAIVDHLYVKHSSNPLFAKVMKKLREYEKQVSYPRFDEDDIVDALDLLKAQVSVEPFASDKALANMLNLLVKSAKNVQYL